MLEERNGDVFYISDDGTEYNLLECRTMGSGREMTSDIVAVFKEGEDGFPVFVNWFAGASLYDMDRDAFLDSCKDFIKSNK